MKVKTGDRVIKIKKKKESQYSNNVGFLMNLTINRVLAYIPNKIYTIKRRFIMQKELKEQSTKPELLAMLKNVLENSSMAKGDGWAASK